MSILKLTVTTRILREVEAGAGSFQREREAWRCENRQLLFKSLRLRSYIIEGGCSPYISTLRGDGE
jgi:hypothetical protein